MFQLVIGGVVRGQPRQASVLACVALAGTRRDLRVKEFLWELVLVVSAPSELVGSFIMEILHSVEGGDVEQVCSNLEIIFSCLRLLISLSLTHLCFISCMFLLCLSLYA